jgi:hypothetical protein
MITKTAIALAALSLAAGTAAQAASDGPDKRERQARDGPSTPVRWASLSATGNQTHGGPTRAEPTIPCRGMNTFGPIVLFGDE